MAEVSISGETVLVDDEDLEKLKEYSWWIRKQILSGTQVKYIYGDKWIDKKRTRVLLHRYIMGCSKGDGNVVDHANHNTLDNRKQNLRVCTSQENNYNSRTHRDSGSKHKGIRKRDNKWEVRLSVGKKSLFIGLVWSLEEAIELHDIASLFYHKEFACTEHPKDRYKHITNLEDEIARRIFREYTSKYRGVTHIQNDGDYYRATLNSKGKTYNIGCFKNEDDAARAYNEYAIKLHGDKAKLNEVPDVTR